MHESSYSILESDLEITKLTNGTVESHEETLTIEDYNEPLQFLSRYTDLMNAVDENLEKNFPLKDGKPSNNMKKGKKHWHVNEGALTVHLIWKLLPDSRSLNKRDAHVLQVFNCHGNNCSIPFIPSITKLMYKEYMEVFANASDDFASLSNLRDLQFTPSRPINSFLTEIDAILNQYSIAVADVEKCVVNEDIVTSVVKIHTTLQPRFDELAFMNKICSKCVNGKDEDAILSISRLLSVLVDILKNEVNPERTSLALKFFLKILKTYVDRIDSILSGKERTSGAKEFPFSLNSDELLVKEIFKKIGIEISLSVPEIMKNSATRMTAFFESVKYLRTRRDSKKLIFEKSLFREFLEKVASELYHLDVDRNEFNDSNHPEIISRVLCTEKDQKTIVSDIQEDQKLIGSDIQEDQKLIVSDIHEVQKLIVSDIREWIPVSCECSLIKHPLEYILRKQINLYFVARALKLNRYWNNDGSLNEKNLYDKWVKSEWNISGPSKVEVLKHIQQAMELVSPGLNDLYSTTRDADLLFLIHNLRELNPSVSGCECDREIMTQIISKQIKVFEMVENSKYSSECGVYLNASEFFDLESSIMINIGSNMCKNNCDKFALWKSNIELLIGILELLKEYLRHIISSEINCENVCSNLDDRFDKINFWRYPYTLRSISNNEADLINHFEKLKLDTSLARSFKVTKMCSKENAIICEAWKIYISVINRCYFALKVIKTLDNFDPTYGSNRMGNKSILEMAIEKASSALILLDSQDQIIICDLSQKKDGNKNCDSLKMNGSNDGLSEMMDLICENECDDSPPVLQDDGIDSLMRQITTTNCDLISLYDLMSESLLGLVENRGKLINNILTDTIINQDHFIHHFYNMYVLLLANFQPLCHRILRDIKRKTRVVNRSLPDYILHWLARDRSIYEKPIKCLYDSNCREKSKSLPSCEYGIEFIQDGKCFQAISECVSEVIAALDCVQLKYIVTSPLSSVISPVLFDNYATFFNTTMKTSLSIAALSGLICRNCKNEGHRGYIARRLQVLRFICVSLLTQWKLYVIRVLQTSLRLPNLLDICELKDNFNEMLSRAKKLCFLTPAKYHREFFICLVKVWDICDDVVIMWGLMASNEFVSDARLKKAFHKLHLCCVAIYQTISRICKDKRSQMGSKYSEEVLRLLFKSELKSLIYSIRNYVPNIGEDAEENSALSTFCSTRF